MILQEAGVEAIVVVAIMQWSYGGRSSYHQGQHFQNAPQSDKKSGSKSSQYWFVKKISVKAFPRVDILGVYTEYNFHGSHFR